MEKGRKGEMWIWGGRKIEKGRRGQIRGGGGRNSNTSET